MKKLVSMIIALVMVFSVTSFVFAEDNATAQTGIDVKANAAVPQEIKDKIAAAKSGSY
jgi:hypothetical protein